MREWSFIFKNKSVCSLKLKIKSVFVENKNCDPLPV